jgi:hypothetical protein
MYTPFNAELYYPNTSTASPYFPEIGDLHPNQDGGDLMAPVWYAGIVAAEAPEPGSLVILATALTAIIAYAWRRRKLGGG